MAYIPFRVILIGASGTGKSTICQRLRDVPVDEVAQPTIFADYCRWDLKDPPGMAILIADMQGTLDTDNSELMPSHSRGVKAILLVCDVTRADTFTALRTKWLPALKRYDPYNPDKGCFDCPVLLIANKMDLVRRWERGERPTPGERNPPAPRRVSSEDLVALAKHEQIEFLAETSAMEWSRERDEVPFDSLYRAMRARFPLERRPVRSTGVTLTAASAGPGEAGKKDCC